MQTIRTALSLMSNASAKALVPIPSRLALKAVNNPVLSSIEGSVIAATFIARDGVYTASLSRTGAVAVKMAFATIRVEHFT